MALKGNYVTFRRQTREHDREDDGSTEHYIIENNERRRFMGYVTVRHIDEPREMAATVLLQGSGDWDSPEGKDILRAIEKYAFDATDATTVALEVNGGDDATLKKLSDSGFAQREAKGKTVILVKERAATA